MTATAIISLKQCRECGARAPIGYELDHESSCSGSPNICDVVQGAWPLRPGDTVVALVPEEAP